MHQGSERLRGCVELISGALTLLMALTYLLCGGTFLLAYKDDLAEFDFPNPLLCMVPTVIGLLLFVAVVSETNSHHEL